MGVREIILFFLSEQKKKKKERKKERNVLQAAKTHSEKSICRLVVTWDILNSYTE